jgi:adenylate cyclase class IV
MKNKEIEFKYFAKVTLTEFKEFCEKRNPERFLIISGYDHFYMNSGIEGSFYRHRVNTNENQLTFKKKTTVENNFIREEHNIDLPLDVSQEKIKDLCNINGYQYNTSIFKNCFIYNYSYYTLVFYICYDVNLNELNRFIEIEMKEDFDWTSEIEAMGALTTLERLCGHLKVDPTSRINQSLFEMYRK